MKAYGNVQNPSLVSGGLSLVVGFCFLSVWEPWALGFMGDWNNPVDADLDKTIIQIPLSTHSWEELPILKLLDLGDYVN